MEVDLTLKYIYIYREKKFTCPSGGNKREKSICDISNLNAVYESGTKGNVFNKFRQNSKHKNLRYILIRSIFHATSSRQLHVLREKHDE